MGVCNIFWKHGSMKFHTIFGIHPSFLRQNGLIDLRCVFGLC